MTAGRSGRNPRRSWFVGALALLIVLQAATPVWAWGRLGHRVTALKGTVEDWATENPLAARRGYQMPETGQRLKPGQKLAKAYFDAHLPVVRSPARQQSPFPPTHSRHPAVIRRRLPRPRPPLPSSLPAADNPYNVSSLPPCVDAST